MFKESNYRKHPLFIAESQISKALKPWILYSPTFNGRPPGQHLIRIFKYLMERGISIVSLDIGENCGGNQGVELLQNLSKDLYINRGFKQKFVLFGGSRGALNLYNLALLDPKRVAAIAAVYPVTNLYDYPGTKIAKKLLNIEKNDKRALFELNPIQNVYKLASYSIPIFHIHGNQDKIVSLVKNSVLLKRSYEHYGGSMELQIINGLGHEKSSLFFESPKLMEFIARHA